MSETFETVEVPFFFVGNRMALARHQIEFDPAIRDFFERFRNCFDEDEMRDIYVLNTSIDMREARVAATRRT